MIWVSPYEDPSKGKDILLNKRHQWIAVRVDRYAKTFKIDLMLINIPILHIFLWARQNVISKENRRAGQASFYSPEIWSAYPVS